MKIREYSLYHKSDAVMTITEQDANNILHNDPFEAADVRIHLFS